MTAQDALPLVSIVTSVYNGAQYLEELIQSVLQQDYPNIEHIVIDDGSNDDGATVEILKRYPHLRWWSRENKGLFATLNEGIAVAKGALVGIINADDIYLAPSAISSAVRYWMAHPDCKFIYGKTLRIDENSQLLPVQVDTTQAFPAWCLRYHLFIQHCSLFVCRDVVVSHSVWFDPRLRYAGDWDWIIRLADTGYKFGYLDQPLAAFRQHGGQTTQRARLAELLVEHRLVCERYGTSYRLYLVLRRLLDYRSMAMKGIWALRTGGIILLSHAVRD